MLLVGRRVLLGVVQVLPLVGLVLIVELVVGAEGVRVGVLVVLLAVGTGVGTTEGNKLDVGFDDGTLVVRFAVLVVVKVEEGRKEDARDGQSKALTNESVSMSGVTWCFHMVNSLTGTRVSVYLGSVETSPSVSWDDGTTSSPVSFSWQTYIVYPEGIGTSTP